MAPKSSSGPDLFADSTIHLGFRHNVSSVHLSRTIMLDELESLFAYTGDAGASKSAYFNAIVIDNCLGKRSDKTRNLTYTHLTELYGLDPAIPLFKALLFFWHRDAQARPLLALLLASARDPLLRNSAPFIAQLPPNSILKRESTEAFIESQYPDRYSPATLKSAAQNTNSSWTKSGHLTGRTIKRRSKANPTAANVAFAMYISHILGLRGTLLLESEYIKMLDAPRDTIISLAEIASQKGWMIFKRVGDVIEVNFPYLT
jgi:hypothetical protein